MGFRQMKQCSTATSPWCFGHGTAFSTPPPISGAVSTALPCVAVDVLLEMDNLAGAAGAGAAEAGAAARTGVGTRIAVDFDAGVTRGAGGGVATASGTVAATGAGARPSSCRTRSLIGPDKSSPQPGQTNRTGSRAMSGVTSIAYLAPQLHWTFITLQGLGFSNTTGGVRKSGNGAFTALETTLPSPIIKLPPPLP